MGLTDRERLAKEYVEENTDCDGFMLGAFLAGFAARDTEVEELSKYCGEIKYWHNRAEDLAEQLTAEKAKSAKLVEALEFYDNAHRKNWAIDLNLLNTTAKEALEKWSKPSNGDKGASSKS